MSIEFLDIFWARIYKFTIYSHILMCEKALNINKLPKSMCVCVCGTLKFACFISSIMNMLIHNINMNGNHKYMDCFSR